MLHLAAQLARPKSAPIYIQLICKIRWATAEKNITPSLFYPVFLSERPLDVLPCFRCCALPAIGPAIALMKKLKHFSTLTWASASQRANGIQHVLCHAKTVQKHYASLWQNRVRWGKTKFITPPERPCAPTLVTRLNLCGQQDSLYASQNNPNNDAHS